MSPDLGRRERMVAMYRRGLGTEEIAEQFSVRTPAVRQALIRAGVYQTPCIAQRRKG
jgi:hypothetical protein